MQTKIERFRITTNGGRGTLQRFEVKDFERSGWTFERQVEAARVAAEEARMRWLMNYSRIAALEPLGIVEDNYV